MQKYIYILLLFVSCQDNDESGVSFENAKISSFKIIENSESGLTVRTGFTPENIKEYPKLNYGYIYYDDYRVLDTVRLGELSVNPVTNILYQKLIKGNSYFIRPFIQFEDTKMIVGSRLNFISNFDVDVKISYFTPQSGFIGDIVSVYGKNFCTSQIYLDDVAQTVIESSDTLIKFVVGSKINKSVLGLKVKSCNLIVDTNDSFEIEKPLVTSISSQSLYPGETLKIKGENLFYDISKLWIGNLEVSIKPSQSTTEIQAIVPQNLPSGKLNIKVQVLDKIVEKENFYNSTSPLIEEITPKKAGFLDTLVIKGKYLHQPNPNTTIRVYLGDEYQEVIKTEDEIRVVLKNAPKLYTSDVSIKIGEFKTQYLPIEIEKPKIVSFDKERYHLDDEMIITTDNFFLASNSIIRFGSLSTDSSSSQNTTNDSSNSDKNIKTYLDRLKLYPDENGMVAIYIENVFGKFETQFSVYPPVINYMNKKSVFILDNGVYLNGVDLGHKEISHILIDESILVTPYFHGNIPYFTIPNLSIGSHYLKIVRSGQKSNAIKFNVNSITATNVFPKSGDRLTQFTVNGTNLDNINNYSILANGFTCKKINASKAYNQIKFNLPIDKLLDEKVEIKLVYGENESNLGSINNIEPYKIVNNYNNSSLYRYTYNFEYKGEFYLLGVKLFKFNLNSLNWETISNPPEDFCGFCNRNAIHSVVEDNLYIINDENTFDVFNFNSKQWSKRKLQIPDGLRMKQIHGVYKSKIIIELSDNGIYESEFLYEYDLSNETYSKIPTSPIVIDSYDPITGFGDSYHKNGVVYFHRRATDVYSFDIVSRKWEDLSNPNKEKSVYNYLFYVYNDVIYISGGRQNIGPENTIREYDLNKKTWKYKTPMPYGLEGHFFYGKDNHIYILGGKYYSGINSLTYKFPYLIDYQTEKDLN